MAGMEIITGVERRRRWRPEEKLRIVAETEVRGAWFAEVAKRHDDSRGLLWAWRSQARRRAGLSFDASLPAGTCDGRTHARPAHSQ